MWAGLTTHATGDGAYLHGNGRDWRLSVSVSVSVTQDKIIFTFTPKASALQHAQLAGIPGCKMSNRGERYSFPATPSVAAGLKDKFPWLEGKNPLFDWLLSRWAVVQASEELIKASNDLPPIPGEKIPSWPHQVKAFWFGYALHAVMLDMGMRTGKTKTAIEIARHRKHKRILVVAPKSVLKVWPNHFAKYADGFKCLIPSGQSAGEKAKEIKHALMATPKDQPLVVLINYESAWRSPVDEVLLSHKWDLVIADESQRIKASGSQVSKFMYEFVGISKQRMCLSGTPMAHTPLDLFGQYRFLDPGIFGTSYSQFEQRYAVFAGTRLDSIDNAPELAAKFRSIAISVPRSVLNLLPPVHEDVPITLEPKAQKVYDQLDLTFRADLEAGTITKLNAGVRILKLRQVTSGFVVDDKGVPHDLGSEKLEALQELIQQMDDNEPVVVIAYFRRDIERIGEMLTSLDISWSEMSGRINKLEEWREGRTRVLIAQERAGSVGVDMTRARFCVLYSIGYSLDDYEQVLARIHGPEQTRSVAYYHLAVEGSVDEQVYEAIQKHRDIIQYVLESYQEKAGSTLAASP